MAEPKTIYDLALHQRIIIDADDAADYIAVIRVPGGWIYEIWEVSDLEATDSRYVFVPYCREFHPDDQDQEEK